MHCHVHTRKRRELGAGDWGQGAGGQAIEQDGTSLQDGRIKVKVYVVTFDFAYYRGKNTNVTTYTFILRRISRPQVAQVARAILVVAELG